MRCFYYSRGSTSFNTQLHKRLGKSVYVIVGKSNSVSVPHTDVCHAGIEAPQKDIHAGQTPLVPIFISAL